MRQRNLALEIIIGATCFLLTFFISIVTDISWVIEGEEIWYALSSTIFYMVGRNPSR